VNDFETKLKTLLEERVDEQVGPRRTPPPFRSPDRRTLRGSARRSPWVLPLLAAACIAAVVGGTLGVSHVLADNHHGPQPGKSVPGPKHTPTPHRSFAPDQSGTVSIDGAFMTLPSGWVARDFRRYEPPLVEGQVDVAKGWCLTPASTPVTVGGCPLWFRAFGDPSLQDGPVMDVDNRGGSYGNPHQVCVPSGVTNRDEQAGQYLFGGRPAEWRHWSYDCASGPAFVAEQYVVPTLPAYVLFSEHVTDTVHQVMSDLAANTTLPAETSPMRLEDFGYIRSITPVSSGRKISIDRTVRDIAANSNHTTYDYIVSNKVYAADAKDLKIGKLAQVLTDGHRVVAINRYGS
jgi:hypothetical protein